MATKEYILSVTESWSHDKLKERYVDLYMAYLNADKVKHELVNEEWRAVRRYRQAEAKLKKNLTFITALDRIRNLEITQTLNRIMNTTIRYYKRKYKNA